MRKISIHSARLPCLGQRHILEAYLALRDRLAIGAPGNRYAPESLDAALNHRLGDDIYNTFAHGAQEVSSFLEGIYQGQFTPHIIVLA